MGVLREENCFASRLLKDRGLTLAKLREEVRQSEAPVVQTGSAFFARLQQWIAEREARGGILAVRHERVANRTAHIAIYRASEPKESEKGEEGSPAAKLAGIQKRLHAIVTAMENAIAAHDFEKARSYSDEERKEREHLRLLREEFHLEEPPPSIPLLCIENVRNDGFSEVQRRCDAYMAEGVAEVWLLDPALKRAYSVNKAEGLRECKGGILQIADPPLEMDLKTIFD
jgi:hypothetical protein